MHKLAAFLESFVLSMIWVFVIIITGYFLLGWLSESFPNNVVGNFADAVAHRAEPQN